MAFLLDEDRLESSLEDVACPLVVAIDPLRVDPVEVAHASRQVRVGRLDHKVVVIAHKAVRIAEPSEAIYYFAKDLKEGKAIGVGEEDLLTGIPTARDVVDSSFVFDPQWPCHNGSLHQLTPRMKT